MIHREGRKDRKETAELRISASLLAHDRCTLAEVARMVGNHASRTFLHRSA
jgi:hypothetical protein